jgi:hypothetical protein
MGEVKSLAGLWCAMVAVDDDTRVSLDMAAAFLDVKFVEVGGIQSWC